jgi:hypothetical protein
LKGKNHHHHHHTKGKSKGKKYYSKGKHHHHHHHHKGKYPRKQPILPGEMPTELPAIIIDVTTGINEYISVYLYYNLIYIQFLRKSYVCTIRVTNKSTFRISNN